MCILIMLISIYFSIHSVWLLRKLLIMLYTRRTERNGKIITSVHMVLKYFNMSPTSNLVILILFSTVTILCFSWKIRRIEIWKKENSKYSSGLSIVSELCILMINCGLFGQGGHCSLHFHTCVEHLKSSYFVRGQTRVHTFSEMSDIFAPVMWALTLNANVLDLPL